MNKTKKDKLPEVLEYEIGITVSRKGCGGGISYTDVVVTKLFDLTKRDNKWLLFSDEYNIFNCSN